MPSTRNHRRTTLGAVNANRARDCLNEGVPSSKKKVPRTRMSMAPRVAGSDSAHGNKKPIGTGKAKTPSKSASRTPGKRQNTVSNAGARTTRVDPRPISDKSFQNNCIRALMDYLTSNGYDQPVTLKMLSRPSGKDFNQIVTFLLRRVDPNFKNDDSMKFEDEVAMTFKTLGYPFSISKTALVAAGSPHTWPSLLAALTWLIEAIDLYDVNKSQDDSEYLNDTDDGALGDLAALAERSDKAFVKYACDAYMAFLIGDDDRYNALEENLVEFCERDHMKVEREIARVQYEVNAKAEQIEKIQCKDDAIPEMAKERESLCRDLEKFHQLVKQLNEHKETLEAKANDLKKTFDGNEQQVQQVRADVEKLNKQVESQEFSVGDVEKMQDEKMLLQEQIEKVAADKLGQNKISWECELELKRTYNQLEQAVGTFNSIVSKLFRFPLIADSVKGGEFLIKVDRERDANFGEVEILGVDIKGDIDPTLDRLEKYCSSLIAKVSEEKIGCLEKNEKREEGIRRGSVLLKTVEAELKKEEDIFTRDKKEQENALYALMQERETVQSQVTAQSNPLEYESDMEKLREKYAQLLETQNKLREKESLRKEAVHAEINAALKAIVEHKEYMDFLLADLEEYLAKVLVTAKVELLINSSN